jgi:hypothetical protein
MQTSTLVYTSRDQTTTTSHETTYTTGWTNDRRHDSLPATLKYIAVVLFQFCPIYCKVLKMYRLYCNRCDRRGQQTHKVAFQAKHSAVPLVSYQVEVQLQFTQEPTFRFRFLQNCNLKRRLHSIMLSQMQTSTRTRRIHAYHTPASA